RDAAASSVSHIGEGAGRVHRHPERMTPDSHSWHHAVRGNDVPCAMSNEVCRHRRSHVVVNGDVTIIREGGDRYTPARCDRAIQIDAVLRVNTDVVPDDLT